MLIYGWNSHSIRSQKNFELRNGVPNYMFSFPEQYGGTQKGISVTTEFLQEASTQLGLSIDTERIVYVFVDKTFLRNCEHFLPDPIEIPSK